MERIFMGKEIEIKFQIDQVNMSILKDWLKNNVEYLGENDLTDYYLDNPKSSFYHLNSFGYKDVLEFFRVRITQKENFICYKKRTIDLLGKTLSVDELEMQVEDGLKILEIFKQIGFTDQIILKKHREFFLINNTYELVIDSFEKIGTFIEIELKKESDEIQENIKAILELVKKIGIKKIKIFDRGYLCMALNPTYEFGKNIDL